MPVTNFTVELPDGSHHDCYSPSSVVKKFFTAGQTLEAGKFLADATEALTEASRRVTEKLGFT